MKRLLVVTMLLAVMCWAGEKCGVEELQSRIIGAISRVQGFEDVICKVVPVSDESKQGNPSNQGFYHIIISLDYVDSSKKIMFKYLSCVAAATGSRVFKYSTKFLYIMFNEQVWGITTVECREYIPVDGSTPSDENLEKLFRAIVRIE